MLNHSSGDQLDGFTHLIACHCCLYLGYFDFECGFYFVANKLSLSSKAYCGLAIKDTHVVRKVIGTHTVR